MQPNEIMPGCGTDRCVELFAAFYTRLLLDVGLPTGSSAAL